MNVLRITSSPRGDRSISEALGSEFLGALMSARPEVNVDHLDVGNSDLPEFDGRAIGAKYKGVSDAEMDAVEDQVWKRIQALVARFEAADRLVLEVPMWNFSIPYKLKQLIDIVCQRNMLFTFDGRKFGPLLNKSRALVIYSRSQTYDEPGEIPASVYDHQSTYIDFWLKFIGVDEVRRLIVENTWSDRREEVVSEAKAKARAFALDF